MHTTTTLTHTHKHTHALPPCLSFPFQTLAPQHQQRSSFPGAPHGQVLAVEEEEDTCPPHWRQAAWMLEEAVNVRAGQVGV